MKKVVFLTAFCVGLSVLADSVARYDEFWTAVNATRKATRKAARAGDCALVRKQIGSLEEIRKNLSEFDFERSKPVMEARISRSTDIAQCLEANTAASGAVSSSISITVNGEVVDDFNSVVLKRSDQVRVTMKALDPLGGRMEYKYFCSGIRESNWAEHYNVLEFEVGEQHVSAGFVIVMMNARNDDGWNEAYSESGGDIQVSIRLDVHQTGYRKVKVESPEISVNGNPADESTVLRLGDRVRVTLAASDPNDGRIEYRHHLFAVYRMMSEWTEDGNTVEFAVGPQHVAMGKFRLLVYVRNDDGLNETGDSLWGDARVDIRLAVDQTDFKRVAAESYEILVNGDPADESTVLRLGDRVRVTLTASDPNGGQIEYRWKTLSKSSDWAEDGNVLEFEVSQQDVAAGLVDFEIFARNKDGLYESGLDLWGDVQFNNTLAVDQTGFRGVELKGVEVDVQTAKPK